MELFELAVSRCRDDGFRPQLTRSYSHYVEMLLDRDKPGGGGRVFAVQDEALALTRDTGTRPLADASCSGGRSCRRRPLRISAPSRPVPARSTAVRTVPGCSVQIDIRLQTVDVRGEHVELTQKEFGLLVTLVQRTGRPASARELSDAG